MELQDPEIEEEDTDLSHDQGDLVADERAVGNLNSDVLIADGDVFALMT